MNTLDRIALIKQRLEAAFAPTQLEVTDDSSQHKGHAGSRDGAGHYTVFIEANCFKGKLQVTVHREIYHVLSDMIPEQIHALQIKVKHQ